MTSIIVIALIIGIYFLIRAQSNNNLINSAQGQIILFYKDGCPACVAVEKFIQDNNVGSKVLFEEKEVSNDAQNEKLLVLLAEKKCNLESEISLPMIWDGLNSKCIIGEQDGINFFQEKITSDPLAGTQNQLIFFYGEG